MQPKMHTESDNSLRDAVQRQLEWDPEIRSQDISVSAKDGTITLTGFVHSYMEKVAAERSVKSVYGVRAIANDIELSKAMERSDPEIARDVVHALRLDVRVPHDHLTATVRDGFVTLEGTVEWNFQREAAETCARKITDVRGITNKIELARRVSPTEVQTKIEEALRRSAEIDARRINVTTHEGTVTLTGNVRSFFERDQARWAVWSAPGVTKVIDQLTIVP